MTTPSHFIITAALARRLRQRLPVPVMAVLIGSVAPDIPLFLLSTGTALYYRLTAERSITNLHSFMFDELFFNNPFWIASHNFLHAPLLLALGLLLSRLLGGKSGAWWSWFFVAASFHTIIDILTHATDGPLLLFPLNWTLRFHSPVSYWDPNHYGGVFRWLELTLDLTLLAYLLMNRYRERARRATGG